MGPAGGGEGGMTSAGEASSSSVRLRLAEAGLQQLNEWIKCKLKLVILDDILKSLGEVFRSERGK